MDIEQLQEIINVLNNKLAQANLQHAVAETELNKANRKINELQLELNARVENTKVVPTEEFEKSIYPA